MFRALVEHLQDPLAFFLSSALWYGHLFHLCLMCPLISLHSLGDGTLILGVAHFLNPYIQPCLGELSGSLVQGFVASIQTSSLLGENLRPDNPVARPGESDAGEK